MFRAILLLLTLLIPPFPAFGQVQPHAAFMAGMPPARLCRPALDLAERRHAIPARLLHAIGRVESGRTDPATGQASPWPWTANAEGQGFYFNTKAEAIAAISAMRQKGVRSIDVGCMQINLMHHPDAFSGLEQAFDPMANADYAARFLRKLFDQTGSWQKAAAWYHSATPELGEAYQKRVMAVWPEEQKLPASSQLAAAWGATLGGSLGGAGITGRGRVLPNISTPQPNAEPAGAQSPPPGRTLESYRAAPITWVYRPTPQPASTPRPPIPPTRSGVHFLR